MPAPATVAEFVEVVRKSGLVDEAKLGTAVSRLEAGPTSPDLLAQALVRDGLLTKFQAKQMKLGRYKRFTIGSKYRLLELLGVGGMGAVYLCEHTFMRRLVALKVLPLDKMQDRSNLERFYREARAVAALDHPNIVRAYDIDQFDKMHFLVMEYVDGTSLQEIVARYDLDNRFFDPVRAAHYVAQAAVGLQHAHDLGMVHRDVKPGNLLLDRTGVVKLLDMGLARFFDDKTDNLTARYDDKCVLGTADYLAPEQAVSNVVDIRADIYALGGTFHFLLTGKSPAPDGTIAQKLVFHQSGEPRPVEEFRPDVPAGMLAVLRKMMRKSRDDRYQTPAEVADALAPWADRDVPPPPAGEMPDLCPAVLALAGHSADRRGPATRGVPAPPRASLRPGSSGRLRRPAEGDPEQLALDTPEPLAGQAQVPTVTSGATAPMPRPSSPSSAVLTPTGDVNPSSRPPLPTVSPGTTQELAALPPDAARRRALATTAVVVAGLLAAVGTVAALMMR